MPDEPAEVSGVEHRNGGDEARPDEDHRGGRYALERGQLMNKLPGDPDSRTRSAPEPTPLPAFSGPVSPPGPFSWTSTPSRSRECLEEKNEDQRRESEAVLVDEGRLRDGLRHLRPLVDAVAQRLQDHRCQSQWYGEVKMIGQPFCLASSQRASKVSGSASCGKRPRLARLSSMYRKRSMNRETETRRAPSASAFR